MASPYVAGVAALLLSKYPHLSAAAIKIIIMNGVDIVTDSNGNSVFNDLCISGGKLNAYKALNSYKLITSNSTTNILPNLNNGQGLFGFSNYGSGFVKFSLQATKTSGNVTYPEGIITIKNSLGETIKKCDISGFSDDAINQNGESNLIAFLPRSGYYYIDIDCNDTNLSSLTLTTETISSTSTSVDLFNYTEAEQFYMNLMPSIQPGDTLKQVILNQGTQFQFNCSTNGNARLVILKRDSTSAFAGLDVYTNQAISGSCTITKNLDAGTYYIGYFNLETDTTASVSMNRIVTQYGSNVMITDPDAPTPCGSQITVVERDDSTKSFRQTFITEGFTRLIYLNYPDAPSLSRLDYYWYSSNDNVATVSDYGTVFGINVTSDTTVKIMAVYKNDMSKVFIKEFTILNDTDTYASKPIDINLSMSVPVSKYTTINFGSTPVPIYMLQYYSWSSSNNNYATVDGWGRIYAYSSAIGQTVTITGTYQYNPRVKVFITVTITN